MKNNYGITTQGFRRLSQINNAINPIMDIYKFRRLVEDGDNDILSIDPLFIGPHLALYDETEDEYQQINDNEDLEAQAVFFTLEDADLGPIRACIIEKKVFNSGIRGNKKTGFKYDYKRVWKVNLGEPWLSDANKKYIEEQEYESFDEALEDAQEYLGWDEVIEIDVGDGYFLYPSEEDAEEGAEDYSFDGPSIREIEKEVYPENDEDDEDEHDDFSYGIRGGVFKGNK